MSCTQAPFPWGLKVNQSHFFPIEYTKPSRSAQFSAPIESEVMWRKFSKLLPLPSRTPVKFFVDSLYYHHSCPITSEKLAAFPNKGKRFLQVDQVLPRKGWRAQGYAGLVEEVVSSSTDVDEEAGGGEKVQKLCNVVRRMEHNLAVNRELLDKREEMVGSSSSSTDADEVVGGGDDGDGEVQKWLNGLENGEERQQKKERRRGRSGYEYRRLKRRQVKIETEAWEQATKEYQELLKEMCEKKLAPSLPYMKSLFLGWFEPLCSKIAEYQKSVREGKQKAEFASYLDLLPPDKMAVITMHKLMGMVMTGGDHGSVRVVAAACSLGEAIEQEVRIHKFLMEEKTKKASKAAKLGDGWDSDPVIYGQERLHKKVNQMMKKQKVQLVNRILKRQDASSPWKQKVRAQVGSCLIEMLMQSAYIQPPVDSREEMPPDIRPAFVHTMKRSSRDGERGRIHGVIECDPLVHKGLERTPRHMVIPYMPMLIPPVKWTGYDKGAHLFLPSYIMRVHGSKQQREAVRSAPRKNMQPVFEALDTLGSTKWRINKRVLAVVDRIWSAGGRLAHMVDRNDIPLPEKPDTEDEQQIKKWKWKVSNVKKENREKHGLRCDMELKLAVARKLKDEAGFYYPHNLDFRGRAYPMHPHLNHLGSDISRGILEFAEGRPLGKSGLRWLKIHLANLFAGGVDKLSLEGRLAFTENHLDDIFDSADRPLEGQQWWLNAEDPFQCLAACINLAEALKSPSPETTISHIAVHQDGSCNGLQHYAALGRDKLGALAVNLIGGEKPADVYSEIAARVLDICKRDAQIDPVVFPEAVHARFLINQVDRKLVKQTVMTSVYGVTFIGARDQIKRRLKERDNVDYDELHGAAGYAAKITLTALEELFESARSIMNWLADCAKVIASENQPVRWTTPLGLPVVQPYRKHGTQIVKTSLQFLALQYDTDKVMVKRQRTAFPPNFVHSLDGSHMMMTAVACKRAGLDFAGVHDSYWTHACNVDEMNRILREKFVELYQKPILENLLEEFHQSNPELSFPPLPERGDLDLNDVLNSPYFFN